MSKKGKPAKAYNGVYKPKTPVNSAPKPKKA